MAGPFYEFVKVAFKIDQKALGESMGRGAGEEIYERGSKALGKHKKDVAGLGLGALAGKALLGRGSLGALLGLAAARHKDIAEAAKKGYGEARKKIA